MLTFATDISATTVYSLNVLVPMKWNRVFPLHEKRDVPSGITPLPCVPLQIFKQKAMIIIHHNDLFKWLHAALTCTQDLTIDQNQ